MGIKVETFKNRLRIRFKHKGVFHCTYLGSALSDRDRALASMVAAQIDLAIATGTFNGDPNLYKDEQAVKQSTLEEALSKRLTNKWNYVEHTLLNLLLPKFGKVRDKADATKFLKWLQETRKVQPSTAHRYLTALKTSKPDLFGHLKVRVSEKHKDKAFSEDEVKAILSAFRDSEYYDFIFTGFSTGMRMAELIGLRFKSVEFQEKRIEVSETLRRIRGGIEFERAPTKTHKIRTVPMNPLLVRLLLNRWEKTGMTDGDALVFGPNQVLDYQVRRVWKKKLDEAGVRYRPIKNMRHTFVSHCLQEGWQPLEICRMTGHSVKILLNEYASLIRPIEAPEFFSHPPRNPYED